MGEQPQPDRGSPVQTIDGGHETTGEKRLKQWVDGMATGNFQTVDTTAHQLLDVNHHAPPRPAFVSPSQPTGITVTRVPDRFLDACLEQQRTPLPASVWRS